MSTEVVLPGAPAPADHGAAGTTPAQGAPAPAQAGTQAPESKPVPTALGDDKDPKPAPAPGSDDVSNVFEYDPTGDAGLDYALKFIGDRGYGPDHPAVVAARGGDFALIRAELAAKGVQGGDAVIALAESAFKSYMAKAEEASKALQALVVQAAGGEENWNTVRAWASANAEPDEKEAVNAALAQGGFVAEAVVKQLIALYQQGNTLPKEAARVVTPGAATSAAPVAGPLTAQAYAQAVRELHSRLGNRMEDSREYADLQQRRLAARNSGY